MFERATIVPGSPTRESWMGDRQSSEERGSMLIIALAVLALLAVIAVTFAGLMRLERKATFNFKNLKRAEQISSAPRAESTLSTDC